METKRSTKRRGNGEGSIYQREKTGRWEAVVTVGLHWRDVDLKAGTVSVRHILGEVRGVRAIAEPKTAKSRRLITLPPLAVDALHDHRRRMMAEGHAGIELVIFKPDGCSMYRAEFHRCEFKPLLKAAGLPDIRFHDLRHSHATLLLSMDVHPKVVQERLGHSHIGITMDVYTHVLPTMQREAADKLGAMLSASSVKAAGA